MVHHLVIGIIFLIWGIADVLRVQLPGILGKRLESASAEARRLWQRLLGILELIVGGEYHHREDDARRSLHPRAVLPLAEAGKREHTGMNHGRKQYGALVLRSREL